MQSKGPSSMPKETLGYFLGSKGGKCNNDHSTHWVLVGL